VGRDHAFGVERVEIARRADPGQRQPRTVPVRGALIEVHAHDLIARAIDVPHADAIGAQRLRRGRQDAPNLLAQRAGRIGVARHELRERRALGREAPLARHERPFRFFVAWRGFGWVRGHGTAGVGEQP
jgi:hypothetical protein